MVQFEKIEPTKKISEIAETYKRKLEAGMLPPDPARVVEYVLRGLPSLEHILPIPPLLEKIHSEVVEPLVEALPRLPLTSEPPKFKWKEWVKEL